MDYDEDSTLEISFLDISTQSQETLLSQADSIIRSINVSNLKVTSVDTASPHLITDISYSFTVPGAPAVPGTSNKICFDNFADIRSRVHSDFEDRNDNGNEELLLLDLSRKKSKAHHPLDKLNDDDNTTSYGLNVNKTPTTVLSESESESVLDLDFDDTRRKLQLMSTIKKLLDDNKKAAQRHKTNIYELRNPTWTNCEFINDRLHLKPLGQVKTKLIISSRNKNKFSIMTLFLEKILYALKENVTYTKRGLYYKHIKLFKGQAQVDRIIDDISHLLNAGPWDFNIYSTCKGLVYGDVELRFKNDETIKCNMAEGVLIPQKVGDIVDMSTTAQFVLIVEKDTIFQELLDKKLNEKFVERFILITGKGYPDTNTRLFVRKLCDTVKLPIYILTDSDPYGIEIMFTYRFGSLNYSHLSNELAIPEARWIGIFYRDIPTFGIANMQLTKSEIKKTQALQKRPYVEAHEAIKKELADLIKWKCKAEIEGLLKNDTYLSTTYLRIKINEKDFI